MSRNAALRGQDVVLSVYFLDSTNAYIDPALDENGVSTLKLSLYPPGKDPRDAGTTSADAWVRGITLESSGEGPYANPARKVIRQQTGMYSYLFNIPSDCDLGSGYDRWEGVVDLEQLDETLYFVIVGGGSVGTTHFYENNMVIIKLRGNVGAEDGTILSSDYVWYFTTLYNPLYTSARRIQLDLGSIASDLPEDTINQAIFEASIEVEAYHIVTTVNSSKEVSMYNFARQQYVVCRTELILLEALMNKGVSVSDQVSKKLADLSVTRGGGSSAMSGILGKLDKCMEKWITVLQSGGVLGPGTSQKPSVAIKGSFDPDRPLIGRDWSTTNTYDPNGATPGANAKFRIAGTRRWKNSFRGSRWDSNFDD